MKEGNLPAPERIPYFGKLHLGRAAIAAAAIEIPAAVASILTGESAYIQGATYFIAVAVGGTLHESHNYWINGYPKNDPMSFFIKDKPTDSN